MVFSSTFDEMTDVAGGIAVGNVRLDGRSTGAAENSEHIET